MQQGYEPAAGDVAAMVNVNPVPALLEALAALSYAAGWHDAREETELADRCDQAAAGLQGFMLNVRASPRGKIPQKPSATKRAVVLAAEERRAASLCPVLAGRDASISGSG
jgi:hypothetical protein